MPKLDIAAIEPVNRTAYPPPHDKAVAGRWQRRFAQGAGMEKLGANHVTLKPGAWTSQRHWHHHADELVVMLEGEAVLVEDEGETLLRAGDIAVFPGGVANGHVIQNRSAADCTLLAVSAGHETDSGEYSDIDMCFGPGGYARKDGTPY
jgi:uncharacterized cupin superfamily protein